MLGRLGVVLWQGSDDDNDTNGGAVTWKHRTSMGGECQQTTCSQVLAFTSSRLSMVNFSATLMAAVLNLPTVNGADGTATPLANMADSREIYYRARRRR